MDPKTEEGIKKTPHRFTPVKTLLDMASASNELGAQKYGAFNWRRQPISLTTHLEAVFRHLSEYADGQDCAEDSGIDHRDAALTTLAILRDAEKHGMLIDDRGEPLLKEQPGDVKELPQPLEMYNLNQDFAHRGVHSFKPTCEKTGCRPTTPAPKVSEDLFS